MVLLQQVPALAQQHNASCEAASVRMVLSGRGIEASEEDILRRMGHHANPHLGFRGDVDGDIHRPDLANYGAYAEVVERVLSTYGVKAQAAYGLSDEGLRQALRERSAVIVWLSNRETPRKIEENGYYLVEGEHADVAIGLLKDGRFLVHDPWGARADTNRLGTFPLSTIPNWDLFDRMAVVIPMEHSSPDTFGTYTPAPCCTE
jgi:uncharacterized protein YvpB